MSLTAVRAAAYLHHLAATSPDPERLAKFYADTMDMTAAKHGTGWLCTGPGRRMHFTEGAALPGRSVGG